MLTALQKRKFTKLFSMYDACNTGVLKFSDFEQIVKNLAAVRGWKVNSAQYNAILSQYMHEWARLKDEADQKGDRQVWLDDWLAYHEALLEKTEKYKQEVELLTASILDVFDVNGDGKLSKVEWKEFFKVYNIPVIYSDEVFAKLDENQDGFLSKSEILKRLQDFYYSNDPEAIGNYMFGPF